MSRLALLILGIVTLGACTSDGRSDYVGTWRAADADSLDMRYQFFADGTARIVERGAEAPEVYEARYQVIGDSILTLRWIDDLGPDGRFRIALDADTLHLENPAGGQRTTWIRL